MITLKIWKTMAYFMVVTGIYLVTEISRGTTMTYVPAEIRSTLCITLLIKMAAQYKTWNVFSRSNTGIVGSNPTRGMDVYVLYSVCRDWSPVQGVLPTVYELLYVYIILFIVPLRFTSIISKILQEGSFWKPPLNVPIKSRMVVIPRLYHQISNYSGPGTSGNTTVRHKGKWSRQVVLQLITRTGIVLAHTSTWGDTTLCWN
jgi:hypothetical protein